MHPKNNFRNSKLNRDKCQVLREGVQGAGCKGQGAGGKEHRAQGSEYRAKSKELRADESELVRHSGEDAEGIWMNE